MCTEEAFNHSCELTVVPPLLATVSVNHSWVSIQSTSELAKWSNIVHLVLRRVENKQIKRFAFLLRPPSEWLFISRWYRRVLGKAEKRRSHRKVGGNRRAEREKAGDAHRAARRLIDADIGRLGDKYRLFHQTSSPSLDLLSGLAGVCLRPHVDTVWYSTQPPA